MRIEDVLQRIQGEFSEMPGLRLTPPQAQRLWGLDRATCEELVHPEPVERPLEAEPEPEPVGRRHRTRRPQVGWGEAIARAEQGIEPAEAREGAGERHFHDGSTAP